MTIRRMRAHFGSNCGCSFWIGGVAMKDFRRAMGLSASARRASAACEGRLPCKPCCLNPVLPRHGVVVEPTTDAWHLVEQTSTGLIGVADRRWACQLWAKMAMGLLGKHRAEECFGAAWTLEGWRELFQAGLECGMHSAVVGYPGPGMRYAVTFGR